MGCFGTACGTRDGATWAAAPRTGLVFGRVAASGVIGAKAGSGRAASAVLTDEDEDRDLERVGSLERGQPIFLLADTLERRCSGRLGVPYGEAQERRRGIGRAAAGRENTLEG